jgi:PPM family protein phosphatase
MGNIRLTIHGRSDVGLVRTNNEDAFLASDLESGVRLETPAVDVDVRDRGILVVVSDGMGGHAAGDVASALVVESMHRWLSDPAADHSSLQRLIDGAVRRANAEVQFAARAAERRGMGATLTAVLFHDQEAYVAEVGDSRGYLLRAGKLRQITKDQSFVQVLLEAGVLTSEQAKDSPQKNVILQAMGREEAVQAAIGRLGLWHGDRLLLCCDGLSNVVQDAELEAMLGDHDSSTICDRMIALANERGGADNLTAVVVIVEGEGLPLPNVDEDTTQTLHVLQEYRGLPSVR